MTKAVFDLSETLRNTEDIKNKLSEVEKDSKNNYELHQTKFNGRISSSYKEINGMNDDLAKLSSNVSSFSNVKKKNIQILTDFNYLIREYKTVKTICQAHQNFLKIKAFVENLKAYSQRYIFDPKNENETNDEVKQKLVEYHREIYTREEFMCELQLYNIDLNRTDFQIVEECVSSIQASSLDFTIFLLEILEEFIENSLVLSRVDDIIQQETERDELTTKAKEGEKNKDPLLHQISTMYKRYLMRNTKELREKAIKVLKSSIKKKFIAVRAAFVTKLDFVLSDLSFIKENISLSFFSFNDFLSEYHSNLKRLIDQNIDDLDAGEILRLIEFKTDYYETMESKFNKIGEALGERLIESENSLLEKYASTASKKLSAWIENITTSEVEKFTTRDKEVNKDEENKLISAGFINLLQIIKMQLEPIAFNKKVFLIITKTVVDHCEIFKEKICECIENEFIPTCNNKGKPGYEDYCIMFGNSGLRLTQYITSLPQCQSEEVRELGNIFISILKTCNHFLSEFVIFTCKPAINKIFTNDWAEESNILLITLEDFIQDYFKTMCDFSFITFCNELVGCLVNAYFKRLMSNKIKFDGKTIVLLKHDHDAILHLLGMFTKTDDLAEELSPLIKLIPLIETTNEDIFILELKSLKRAKMDISPKMIINIIHRKNDLDQHQKSQLVKAVNEVFDETSVKKRGILNKLF